MRRTMLTTIGQWMQEDPIGFNAGQANLRQYVGNDTPNTADSSGTVGLEDRMPRWVNGSDIESRSEPTLSGIGNFIYNATIGPFVRCGQLIFDILPASFNPSYQPYNPYLRGYLKGQLSFFAASYGMFADTLSVAASTYSVIQVAGQAVEAVEISAFEFDTVEPTIEPITPPTTEPIPVAEPPTGPPPQQPTPTPPQPTPPPGVSGPAPHVDGGVIPEDALMSAAENYLGPGYSEISPGTYRSADGMRQFRFGAQ